MAGEYEPLWLEVKGDLKPAGPFRVGTSGFMDLYSDMPVLRYGERHGIPWLPGSSIRGSLRAHLSREHSLLGVPSSAVTALFGHEGGRGGGPPPPQMGRVRIFHSIPSVTVPAYSSEVRDHVQINPEWGAAADRLKFDAEVMLPPEWKFPLRIVYEGPAPEDLNDLRLLGEAVRAMQRNLIRIGGRSGVGMGVFELSNVSVRKFDRSTEDGLHDWLRYRMGNQGLGILDKDPFPRYSSTLSTPLPGLHPWNSLEFNMKLHCEGPLLVKSAVPGEGSQPAALPTTTGNNAYYVPGSSIRGMLRAHAYRIADSQGIADSQRTEEDPWLRLFGSVKGGSGGRKGLLEVQDGIVADQTACVCSDHVAIDRITGGTAGTAKFDDMALDSPEIQITLGIHFTNDPEDLAAAALLLLVLRDTLDSERRRLWVGSQTTRGYGLIREADFTSIEGSFCGSLPDPDKVPEGLTKDDSRNGRVGFRADTGSAKKAFDYLCGTFDSAWQAVRGRSVPA